MKEIEIRQFVEEKNYLRVKVIFEMLGKPKEHIEKTLKEYIKKVTADPDVEVVETYFADAKEQDDGFWSTFAELELLVKNLQKLTWLSVNFMPASIEILEPSEIRKTNREVGLWLNDVLSRLHEISVMTKELTGKHEIMSKTLGTLMKNYVKTCLDFGVNNKNDLHIKTGIRQDQLQEILNFLEKQGLIQKQGDLYIRKNEKKET